MTKDPTKSPAVSERELLPCPMCGRNRNRLILVEGGSGLPAEAWIECDAMTCGVKGPRFQTAQLYDTTGIKSQAIMAWNNRAILARLAPAPEKGVREALESALRALAMDSTPIIRRLARIQIKEARAALAQPEAARVGEDWEMQREIEILRRALAWHGDPQRMATTREDWQQTIDAAIVWVKANPEDGYASFPSISSAPAPRNANETGQDEASGWRAMADTIKAEIDRQCGIGAGMAATCPDTGLFQVSADLDIASLARAALATQPAAGSEG